MNESAKMIVVLTIIAMISGLLLAQVYHLTYDRIQLGKAQALRGSILAALPGAVDFRVIEAHPVGGLEDDRSTLRSKPGSDSDPLLLFQGLDENGDPVGFAYVCEGVGYGGIIKIMVGVNHTSELISGVAILEHVETPNIGSLIENESFRNQFVGKGTADPIALGQDIDRITGATVSSRAVTEAVNRDLSNALQAYKEAITNE
ncbi:MAG TPA: FMN-binding protein [Firmicutes bacterium]|nr:FMN-binding protein [Bacillota bacterium]